MYSCRILAAETFPPKQTVIKESEWKDMYTECRVKWREARTPCVLFLIRDWASVSLLSIYYLILLIVKPKKILYSQGEDVVLQAALHFPEMIKKFTCQISWPLGKDMASLSKVKNGWLCFGQNFLLSKSSALVEVLLVYFLTPFCVNSIRS